MTADILIALAVPFIRALDWYFTRRPHRGWH